MAAAIVDLLAQQGHLNKIILPGRTRACGFASDEVELLMQDSK